MIPFESKAKSHQRRRISKGRPGAPLSHKAKTSLSPITITHGRRGVTSGYGRRSLATIMAGVLNSISSCIDMLVEVASIDPQISFDGRPAEIINNGLLWNDPRSDCSINNDSTRRMLLDVAIAWCLRDAEKVRKLLEEIKNSRS